MALTSSRLVVDIANESGKRVATDRIRGAVQAAFGMHGIEEGEVSVLITTDEHVRSLNRKYRGIDEATDVLSFHMAEPARPGESGNKIPPILHGDIVIAVPFAERQASARGVSPKDELCHLAVHGALHLIGFDDETDLQREDMIREMSRVALECGLPPDPDWASLHGGGVSN